jgi:AAA domain
MPQPDSSVVVSNSAFLRALAQQAPNGSSLWVTAFGGSPDLTDAQNWHGAPYSAATMAGRVDGWGNQNTYFSVAALKPTGDGELRRRKANFGRLLALVADDAHLEDIQGAVSYVLTTSPGKSQVGIIIDGKDEDAADLQLVGRVVTTMADKGLMRADASGNNAVRYVRLPVGQNQKPRDTGAWQHQMARWAPQVVMSLEDAAAAFGVDLDSLRQAPGAAPSSALSVVPQDDRLRVLTANVLRGENLHDGINQIAASLVATAMPGGAVVNLLRALMEASHAAKDERWQARYQDIPRSVSTAQAKFSRPIVHPDEVADEAGDEEAASKLPLVFAEDVDMSGIKLDQLVEDTITQGGLSVMYGESNSGKSFLACDMDCALASGIEWQGRRTVQGAVLYVAGEGAESIKLRVLAWRQHHGVMPMLAIVPVAINLLDPDADIHKVIKAVAEVEQRYGVPVVKITIDTLARAFGGGNENAAEDMGAVILHADRIRMVTKAHVMFIHHAGKDVAKGSRGHSSLKAATDTEIEVTADDLSKIHTARVTKQRDLGSRGVEINTRFNVVEMGHDQWGKPLTTCVVDSTDEKPPAKANKSKAAELQVAITRLLSVQPNRTMRQAELAQVLMQDGFSRSAIYRCLDQFDAQNVTTTVTGMTHLNGKGKV